MNMRSFWWITLAFTLLWIWLEWQQFVVNKSAPKPVDNVAEQRAPSATPSVNQAVPADGTIPTANAPLTTGNTPTVNKQVVKAERIFVQTDAYAVEIDTHGGDIRSVELLQYMDQDDQTKPFQILGDQAPMMYVAQNGIAKPGNVKYEVPTHNTLYRAEKTTYVLDGENLDVPLYWEKDGITIKKIYSFAKGSHQVGVRYEVTNGTAEDWSGSLYSQIKRNRYDPYFNQLMYTYTGPVLYNPNAEDKYNKHSFDDLQSEPVMGYNAVGGWAAMIQHYFVSAIVPDQTSNNNYYAKPSGSQDYVVGVVAPMVTIPAGESANLTSSYYIGPILQEKLADIAPGLELTIDYGILAPIAVPVFWVLDAIYNVVGNWGWAIIFLTILIKLIFYKLSETSYRSMARLKKFQPKLQQLKENYGDDKAIFQQKMMKLYKEEKINPLGGCLPILVQMPVFIALYWVFMYSTEMRQAEWMLWITDLSAKDPYFILPVLMGLSMWIQQKLNPSVMMDEMQQKVMKFLPIIFTIFFMWFPSGLVLYWLVNNILSVAQQWYITKKIEAGEEK